MRPRPGPRLPVSPCLLRVFVPPVVLCLAPVSRTPVLARITSPLITARMRREPQSQHSISHQQSRVLITVIMIMHSDLSAGFFMFSMLFWRWTNWQAASFTYIIISNGLESKILCSPNDQNMFDTRRNVPSYVTMSPPHSVVRHLTSASAWREWPEWAQARVAEWHSESDIKDSTFDELDFIKTRTRMKRLKRERSFIVLWFQCRLILWYYPLGDCKWMEMFPFYLFSSCVEWCGVKFSQIGFIGSNFMAAVQWSHERRNAFKYWPGWRNYIWAASGERRVVSQVQCSLSWPSRGWPLTSF